MTIARLLRKIDARMSLAAASLCDHPHVLQLLETLGRRRLDEEFQSQIEGPTYDPSDRVLLQCGDRTVGHLRMSRRIGLFEGQRISVARLEEYGLYPEFQETPYEEALIAQAEELASDEGAVLGVIYAERSAPFLRRGWHRLRGQGHSRVNTRAALSHLNAQSSLRRKQQRKVRVTGWRHGQLEALQQLYDCQTQHSWGGLHRSESYWRWLIGRAAQDDILIATPPPRRRQPEGSATEVLGYAVVKDSCVVEIVASPGHSAARTQLFAAICRDAIDRDHRFVSLHAPAIDALHDLLVTAGGTWVADKEHRSGCWLVKLLAPEKWIERCFPLWQQRARDQGTPRPFACTLVTERGSLQFTLTRRSSRLAKTSRRGELWLSGSVGDLESLLIGNLSLPESLARRTLRASSAEAAKHMATVFQPRVFWQPPWELVRL